MPLAIRNPTAKGDMIRAFAAERRVQFLLAHGKHTSDTFKVPEGQIIVFVSRAGKQLPATIINQAFYDIFASANALQKLLTTRSKTLPWFLRGWKRRTYGPGDTCPETVLQLTDPICWKSAMGLHALPLAYPLRSPEQFANSKDPKNVAKAKILWGKRCRTSIEDPAYFYKATGKSPPQPRAGGGNGSTVNLSSLAGRGVLFVAACRDAENERQLKTLDRFAGPIDEEKRKRRNGIVNRDENERARPGKRLKTQNTSSFAKKAAERRDKMKRLEKLKKRILARK